MIKEKYNEKLIIGRQKRAMNNAVKDADFLSKRVAEELSLRVSSINRNFLKCADLFSLSNCVYEALAEVKNVSNITRYERPLIAEILDNNLKNNVLPMRMSKSDVFLKGVDLLVSVFGLHWHNDVTTLLSTARLAMKRDGLLLLAMPARGTLFELQDCLAKAELELCGGAKSRVDQFVDLQQAGTMLQSAGFNLPVIDQETIVVRYADMYALIRDLRAMGATNAQISTDGSKFNRDLFKRANELYLESHSDLDGRIRASFCIAYLSAWSPHESQQKPLKPGSAKISLSRVLKTK